MFYSQKIKQYSFIIALLILYSGLFAQSEAVKSPINSERVYLGIEPQDLSIPMARSLSYREDYGILIVRVIDDTPARNARLTSNDILMAIDNTNINDNGHLSQVLEQYFVGDTVELTIFRDGEILKIPLVLGSKATAKDVLNFSFTVGDSESDDFFTKSSVGWGGGSFYPMWVTLNVKDINSLLSHYQYDKINDNGLFFFGGGGKLHVGKGYFLGGMGAGYSNDQSSSADGITQRFNYSAWFGGVTIDKRLRITNNLVVSPGIMVGGGGHTISLMKTDGKFYWNDLLGESCNTSIARSFFAGQGNFEVLYRLLPWLALRAEVGYIYGVTSGNGWRAEFEDQSYSVKDSPHTPFEGWTFSVGPWFGF